MGLAPRPGGPSVLARLAAFDSGRRRHFGGRLAARPLTPVATLTAVGSANPGVTSAAATASATQARICCHGVSATVEASTPSPS